MSSVNDIPGNGKVSEAYSPNRRLNRKVEASSPAHRCCRPDGNHLVYQVWGSRHVLPSELTDPELAAYAASFDMLADLDDDGFEAWLAERGPLTVGAPSLTVDPAAELLAAVDLDMVAAVQQFDLDRLAS